MSVCVCVAVSSQWLCCFLCSHSISVDHVFINKIDKALKQSKTSCCSMAEFLDILLPYLSVTGCKQLFALYEQVLESRASLRLMFWLAVAPCSKLLAVPWVAWVHFILGYVWVTDGDRPAWSNHRMNLKTKFNVLMSCCPLLKCWNVLTCTEWPAAA